MDRHATTVHIPGDVSVLAFPKAAGHPVIFGRTCFAKSLITKKD
jgi:hypothetical protein